MKLPWNLTSDEIRVMQEFRLRKSEELSPDEIAAIRHPAGGGVAPAQSLVRKGYLDEDEESGHFRLRQRAKDFLAIDYVP
ncbi:MAG: hypothetical protein WBX15_16555 [Thermoanaerobaculia bacterium]